MKAKTKAVVGRPRKKASGMLFKFLPKVEKYLRDEKEQTGKDMVRIIEETLEYRMRFKQFPPIDQKNA